jgi:cell division protein FtsZ
MEMDSNEKEKNVITNAYEDNNIKESNKTIEKLSNFRILGVGNSGNKLIEMLPGNGIDRSFLVNVCLDCLPWGCAWAKSRERISICEANKPRTGIPHPPESIRWLVIEAEKNVRRALSSYKTILMVAGLGGSIGTGASPEIARIFKEIDKNNRVISFVSLPFKDEGKYKQDGAIKAFEKLKLYSDLIIIAPNMRVLGLYRKMPVDLWFKVSDSVFLVSLTALYYSIIGRDFPGFLKSLTLRYGSGISMATYGDSNMNVEEAFNNALGSPLSGIELRDAVGLIATLFYSNNVDENKIKNAPRIIRERLNRSSLLSFNAIKNEMVDAPIRIVLIPIVPVKENIFDRERMEMEMNGKLFNFSWENSID